MLVRLKDQKRVSYGKDLSFTLHSSYIYEVINTSDYVDKPCLIVVSTDRLHKQYITVSDFRELIKKNILVICGQEGIII